ncbi:MAG: exosortase H [Gammaproteobacteria bacterium]|nr:exosortase H [Xanthomonadales bacterium]
MLRFTIIFIVLVLVMFSLELMEPIRQAVILPFTGFLATFSAVIMQFFDSNVVSNADVIMNRENSSHAVRIAAGCNGVEAVIVLFAAIFAFPSSFKHKLIGFVLGFFAIQFVNVIRIISLFYLLAWDKTWFDWFHLYLWQALIILDALIVWLLWLRFLPKKNTENLNDNATV